MKMNLSENIRAMRHDRGLTQEQLAEACGVSVSAVYKWEAGLSVPELGMLMELADFFDTSVDALLGYAIRDNRLEATARRLKEARRAHDPSGLAEAEKALQKYPNSYEVVEAAAALYEAMGFERKDGARLRRAIELLERALLLLPPEVDRAIAERALYGRMAQAWLSLEEADRAVALLEKHNGDGTFDDLIGMTLAHDKARAGEALDHLGDALLRNVMSLSRVVTGYANAYDNLGDCWKEREVLQWAIGAFGGLRGDRPCLLDKLLAALQACLARVELKLGDEAAARRALAAAREVALRFDAAPDYAADTLRFHCPSGRSAYDDLGETALAAAESVALREGGALRDMWYAMGEEVVEGAGVVADGATT